MAYSILLEIYNGVQKIINNIEKELNNDIKIIEKDSIDLNFGLLFELLEYAKATLVDLKVEIGVLG